MERRLMTSGFVDEGHVRRNKKTRKEKPACTVRAGAWYTPALAPGVSLGH